MPGFQQINGRSLQYKSLIERKKELQDELKKLKPAAYVTLLHCKRLICIWRNILTQEHICIRVPTFLIIYIQLYPPVITWATAQGMKSARISHWRGCQGLFLLAICYRPGLPGSNGMPPSSAFCLSTLAYKQLPARRTGWLCDTASDGILPFVPFARTGVDGHHP